MATDFKTADPSKLLKAFKKAIDDGHVVTWSYDSDGDFKHTPSQWADKGWLRPRISTGRLTMTFLGKRGRVTQWADYAVLQGRFIEAMITHCHNLFTSAEAGATPASTDQITTKTA